MLLDLASTPLSVRYQVVVVDVVVEEPVAALQPVGHGDVRSAGVATSSSSTAAIDMTLAVEPGS